MRRFLPALLLKHHFVFSFLLVFLFSAQIRADGVCTNHPTIAQPHDPNCPAFAYDVSETMTVSTTTNQEFVWTFQREQGGEGGVSQPAPFWSYDVSYQTDPSIVYPGITGSFFIHGESVIGTSDRIVPEHTLGLMFGPGLRRRPCLPDCPLLGNLQSFDVLFTDDNFKAGNPPDDNFGVDSSDQQTQVPVGQFSAEAPGAIDPVATPETTSLLLMGTGLIGLWGLKKFRAA
jgi:hypothetical protein